MTDPRTTAPDRHRAGARPMEPGDDLNALNQGNPLGWYVEGWERVAAEVPTFPYYRYTGLLDEQPVGFGLATSAPVSAGGLGGAMVYVLPPARRHGVGTALRRALTERVRGLTAGLSYMVSDDDEDGLAVARAWGLPEAGRHHESVLDLTALDVRAFQARVARVQEQGLSFREMAADADEAAWRRLHGFLQERYREAPDAADGGGDLPYDRFRATAREPWMVLLAEREGEPVGVTLVVPRAGDGGTVNTNFTGVVPHERGRGLAGALKAQHALLLAERGLTRICTQNMVGNDAILAANSRLGFVRDSGYLDVVDRL